MGKDEVMDLAELFGLEKYLNRRYFPTVVLKGVQMQNKFIFCLTVFMLFPILVLSDHDDAPPAIPSEYWGAVTYNGTSVSDGYTITAQVNGINFAQTSTTYGGYYNLFLIDGDRDLTYNNDFDCSTHNATGEVCIPCTPCSGANCVLGYNESTCIEGPQDGGTVSIKIESDGVMPFVDWYGGNSEQVDIVTPIGDWNKDGCVDMGDFIGPFANNYGQSCSLTHPIPGCLVYDLNIDTQIDMGDFIGPFANHYGEGC